MSEHELPTVDEHEYVRLMDCLRFAEDHAVTGSDEIQTHDLRVKLREKSRKINDDEV